MQVKQPLSRLLLLSALGFIGFTSVSLLISLETIQQFDDRVMLTVQAFEKEWLTWMMKILSTIGNTVPVIVISVCMMLILFKAFHMRQELILFTVVLVGSTGLNLGLKTIFQRARPEINQLVYEAGYSFPSGHSMAALSLYGIVAFLLWRHTPTRGRRTALILFTILMIILIGISRIYLGVHYPSDIIGAYFISGFWLSISIWKYQWYQERLYNRQTRKEGKRV